MYDNIAKNSIIVSGMRPTGEIHLGNYNAVIKNWIRLQKSFKTLYFVADIHALTNNFENIYKIKKNIKIMLVEWLASGLDPKKSLIFIQSHIPETLELNIFLSMMVNLSRLERIPTYKAEKNNATSYGFLGYPILQAADVLIFNANYVPVGKDQIPHIEFIKELAKKINSTSQSNIKIFNEPEALLYKHKKVFGCDGKKMSKSKNNAIFITDVDDILKKKINKYITDPNRIYRYQPGNPEKCYVWSMHKIYTEKLEKQYIQKSCKEAKIGCVDCKIKLFDNIQYENIKLIKKVKLYEKREKYINDIIEDGAKNAREIAKKNLQSFKTFYNII